MGWDDDYYNGNSRESPNLRTRFLFPLNTGLLNENVSYNQTYIHNILGKQFCRVCKKVHLIQPFPMSGRSPGERNGNPLQYSCLKNPMDRGAWWATVYGVAKSWTRLSYKCFSLTMYTFLYTFNSCGYIISSQSTIFIHNFFYLLFYKLYLFPKLLITVVFFHSFQ